MTIKTKAATRSTPIQHYNCTLIQPNNNITLHVYTNTNVQQYKQHTLNNKNRTTKGFRLNQNISMLKADCNNNKRNKCIYDFCPTYNNVLKYSRQTTDIKTAKKNNKNAT